MAGPDPTELGQIFDLAAVEQELRREEAYAREGHTARTLVRAHDLRVVLIAMQAGSRVAAHTMDETVSIQALGGRVRLQAPRLARPGAGGKLELTAGQVLVVEARTEHAIEAVGDSAVLLTFGWTPRVPAD